MRNKNFIRLAVIGTIFSLGGVFVVPQFKNNDAQASEPTKLVAFEKQGSHLGKTINSVRGSKTVKVTLDKSQKEAQKKTQAKKETNKETNKETKTSQIATSKAETKETKVESTTTSNQSVEVTSTVTNTSNTNQAPATQPQSAPVQQSAPAQAAPAPQVDTSGFNFNGHHYPIAWFSGTGYVPADGNIYRWSEMPNHYLIERMGMAGGTIRELGIGSQVTIDGRTYTIFKMLSGIANDENAYDLLISQGAAITFQSCDATYGANGLANLTIWFAA